ncbi:MAG: DUF4382 domain-containing protein, partial [Acidobacteria bacterium]|nr:DUF4382 domain-containing protein [Acidobacteriota bacterium]
MLTKRRAASLAVGLAAVILTSCGGNDDSSSGTPRPGTGALYVLISDAPVCDVLSFQIRVTGMTLRPQGTEKEVPVISAASLIKLNFAALRDLTTVLHLSTLDEGTYDRVTITFSRPELGLFDSAEDPPSVLRGLSFSTLKPEIPITPPLTVVKNQVNVLRLHFDMRRSIEVDSENQITGNATPFLEAFPVAGNDEGFGDLHNLVGFVRTVSPFPIRDKFIGS